MSGVYIIEFDIYPGVYKIGKSKDIDSRYKQFKQNTSILGNVKLIYSKEFEDYSKAESDIHLALKDYRVQENREFFKGDAQEFIKVIEGLNSEDYKIIADTSYNKDNREQNEDYASHFKEIADILPDVIDVRLPNYTKHILHILEEIHLVSNDTQKIIEVINTLMKENDHLYKLVMIHEKEIEELKEEINRMSY